MAPIPPTTAGRLRVHYTTAWRNHSMLFHFQGGVTGPEAAAAVDPVLEAMAATLFNCPGFVSAEWYPAGSHISVGQPLTTLRPGGSGTPPVTASPSNFIQFGGRALDGTRVKYYLFGSVFTQKANMRQNYGDNALCDDIIDAINNASGTAHKLGTISAAQFNTYLYANLGQNDYITHKVR